MNSIYYLVLVGCFSICTFICIFVYSTHKRFKRQGQIIKANYIEQHKQKVEVKLSTMKQFNEACTCRCVNHPNEVLIKEDFSGQGYCKLCDNFNLSDEYQECALCRALYNQWQKLQMEINSLESKIETMFTKKDMEEIFGFGVEIGRDITEEVVHDLNKEFDEYLSAISDAESSHKDINRITRL